MNNDVMVGVCQPYFSPLMNLKKAIEEDNIERILRALRQIESVTGFYHKELDWRAHKLTQKENNGAV